VYINASSLFQIFAQTRSAPATNIRNVIFGGTVLGIHLWYEARGEFRHLWIMCRHNEFNMLDYLTLKTKAPRSFVTSVTIRRHGVTSHKVPNFRTNLQFLSSAKAQISINSMLIRGKACKCAAIHLHDFEHGTSRFGVINPTPPLVRQTIRNLRYNR